jgi:hypothetical protein
VEGEPERGLPGHKGEAMVVRAAKNEAEARSCGLAAAALKGLTIRRGH